MAWVTVSATARLATLGLAMLDGPMHSRLGELDSEDAIAAGVEMR